jgi:hypothetical protein
LDKFPSLKFKILDKVYSITPKDYLKYDVGKSTQIQNCEV